MRNLFNRPTLLMAITAIFLLSSAVVHADTTASSTTDSSKLLCPDADFWGKGMLTDICWSCLFPIRLLGFTAFEGNNFVPDGASDQALCSCQGKDGIPSFGITAGMWLPARLVEVVRKPYW